MTQKHVFSHEIMPLIKSFLDQNQSVDITISGHSMTPFYKHHHTVVTLEKPKVIQPLDVVLYQDQDRFKLHRVTKIKGETFIINGDGLSYKEHIHLTQIFGVVIKHKNNQKWIHAHQISYLIKVRLWLLLKPLKRILIKLFRS